MADTVVKKHPLRGALWGSLMGIGVALFLIIGYPVIGIGDPVSLAIQVGLVIAAGVLVGVLWAMFGPAKKLKGDPPRHVTMDEPAPGEG